MTRLLGKFTRDLDEYSINTLRVMVGERLLGLAGVVWEYLGSRSVDEVEQKTTKKGKKFLEVDHTVYETYRIGDEIVSFEAKENEREQ